MFIVVSIAEVIRWLEGRPEETTLLDVLRHFLAEDGDDEEDERVPTATPTHEEILLLLEVTTDRRDRLMFRLLYSTGIRRGELAGLVWADLLDRMLFIRNGKGRQDRYTLLDLETQQQLHAWGWNQPPERSIFGLSPTQIWKRFGKWATVAGLAPKYAELGQRLSPHSLRHSFATHCSLAGMDPTVVQLLLGHDLIATTGLYVHPTWWAERYHQPVQAPATLIPRPLKLPSIYKREVLDFLRNHDPNLPAAALLAAHQLDQAPAWQREFLQDLRAEMDPVELALGQPLPYLPGVEIHDDLGLRFLRRSGARAEELPIRSVDPGTGLVQLQHRTVVVDRALAAQLDPALTVDDTPLRQALEGRYAAIGRSYTPLVLRSALGAELVERGLDICSLHAVLGNRFMETTEHCFALGVRRWLGEYDRCHPLVG